VRYTSGYFLPFAEATNCSSVMAGDTRRTFERICSLAMPVIEAYWARSFSSFACRLRRAWISRCRMRDMEGRKETGQYYPIEGGKGSGEREEMAST